MKLVRLGLAVLVVVVLGLTLVAPVFAAGPSAVPLPPNTAHFWVFYDKYYLDGGYPRGWGGPDIPWDGVYLTDTPWEWAYGAPQYKLTTALGKVISEGYLPEDLNLTLPGDGSYYVTLYPPTGPTPSGQKWQMSGYCKYPNLVVVKDGKVSAYQYGLVLNWAGKYVTGWKYTGDQVLAGIVDLKGWWGQ